MSDKQLKILLEAMLNELEATLQVCEANVPEGIEQPIIEPMFGEPYVGQYEFLLPINELIQTWRERIRTLAANE